MDQTHGTYIGQQLKNLQFRKRNNRRMSTIMSQIRFMSQDEQESQTGHDRIRELDSITLEFKAMGTGRILGKKKGKDKKGKQSKRKRESGFAERRTMGEVDGDNLVRKQKGLKVIGKMKRERVLESTHDMNYEKENNNSQQLRILNTCRQHFQPKKKPSQNFRISIKQKLPTPTSKIPTPSSNFSPSPYSPKLVSTFSSTLYHPLKNISHTRSPSSPNPPSSYFPPQKPLFHLPQKVNLQSQNIHKLNSFLRGAYSTDLTQYSTFVNLNLIDRYRQNFQIYDKIYNDMVENNMENKRGLEECEEGEQSFGNVVLVNEMKGNATQPEFLAVLEKLRIIR